MNEDLKCDKCGIEYMSVHYADNHFLRIGEGSGCPAAYMFKACHGTLRKVERDESNVRTDEE